MPWSVAKIFKSLVAKAKQKEKLKEKRMEQTEQMEQMENEDDWIDEDFLKIASRSTKAMASFLEDGEILLKNYAIEDFTVERDVSGRKRKAGQNPIIHGLVIGKWKGEDVVVLVIVRFTITEYEECRSVLEEVESCETYWNLLIELGRERMDEMERDFYAKKHYRKLCIQRHEQRKFMVALAAQEFAEEFPGNLWNRQEWFRIRPNSKNKFAVRCEG